MTKKEKALCNTIIHAASAAAASVGAGLAQIPGSDNAVITPIQLTMIISLGEVFGNKLTESVAMATLVGASAGTIGRTISQVLIGWIPGVGNIINATTAAGITEAIGWIVANDFANQAKEVAYED